MKKWLTTGVLTACLLALAGPGSSLQEAASGSGAVVFRDVNVVPMTTETVLEHRDVFVSGGKITRIAATGAAAPSGARIIEGHGRYLLPGLMDMHVHMDDDKCVPFYLAYGITRVRNMSADGDHYNRRRRIAEGAIPGPVMYTAGPALTSNNPDYEFNVTSPEQARTRVREAKAAAADWIKTIRLESEIFAAILDEAHLVNLPVGGHLPSLSTPILEIYRSGLRSHEHVAEVFTSASFFNLVPDETKLPDVARQIKATGITISTILHRETTWWKMRQQGDAYLTAERLAEIQELTGPAGVVEARQYLEGLKTETPQVRDRTVRIHSNIPFLLKMVKALQDAGVPLVIGTDSHFYFSVAGQSLHDELDLLHAAGLTPYQALRIATVNGAALLGASGRLGTVEPGKIADLVLVDGNPLAALKGLRAPAGVLLEGRWFDRVALDGLLQNGMYTKEEAAAINAAMARNKEAFAGYVGLEPPRRGCAVHLPCARDDLPGRGPPHFSQQGRRAEEPGIRSCQQRRVELRDFQRHTGHPGTSPV